MKSNILNAYVFNLLNDTEQQLQLYLQDHKPNRLHLIRVNIKKLKAAYSFARKIYDTNDKVTTVQPLFAKAGRIRELQVRLRLLASFPEPPLKIIAHLQNREKVLQQQFEQQSPKYFTLLSKIRQRVNFPEKLGEKDKINTFFEEAREKAKLLLQNCDKESLHLYRIKLKKMMYVYELLPDKVQKDIEWKAHHLKQKLEQLGDWHDIYTALKCFSHQSFSQHNKAFMEQLREKERQQFNALVKPSKV